MKSIPLPGNADHYINAMSDAGLHYPIAADMTFHYPFPMELSPEQSELLSQHQERVMAYYMQKLHETKFDDLDRKEGLFLWGKKIGSKLQRETFINSLQELGPSLTVDYLLVKDQHGNMVPRILEISPRVSYIDHWFDSVKTHQVQELGLGKNYLNRIGSHEKEIDVLKKYRQVPNGESIFVLKPHWWDQPIVYDLQQQAQHGGAGYPLAPSDIFLGEDGQYYGYLRDAQGKIITPDGKESKVGPIKYLLNVMTEEDYKDVEQTAQEKSDMLSGFFSCGNIKRSLPPAFRRFLSKQNMVEESFIQSGGSLCVKAHTSGEELRSGLYFLKSLGGVSGHGARIVSIEGGNIIIIDAKTKEILSTSCGDLYVIPENYVAQEYMFPYPIQTRAHVHADEGYAMKNYLQTVELRCMTPRHFVHEGVPKAFAMRSSCRTDLPSFRDLSAQYGDQLSTKIIHALSHPLTNVGASLLTAQKNAIYLHQSGYGSHGIGPVYLKTSTELITTLSAEQANSVIHWIKQAQEKEKLEGVADGIKTKTVEQLIQTQANHLCLYLGQQLIGYANLQAREDSTIGKVTKVGTVIVNPLYQGQGLLGVMAEEIMKYTQGSRVVMKSCAEALFRTFHHKLGFCKQKSEEIAETDSQFYNFVESSAMGGTTAPNKHILRYDNETIY